LFLFSKVLLAWMHRLAYASALADCGVYAFAKRLAARGGRCAPPTVALIDRVKATADAPLLCPDGPSGGGGGDAGGNPWGQCLAAQVNF
jgi:hypothetical protein